MNTTHIHSTTRRSARTGAAPTSAPAPEGATTDSLVARVR